MGFKENWRLEKVYYENILTVINTLKSIKNNKSADEVKVRELLDSTISEGESIVLIYKNIGELYAEIAAQIQKILDLIKELRDDIEDLKRRVAILEEKVAFIEQQIIAIQGDIEELYRTKQDKLKPGENIVIDDNNVISADNVFVIKYFGDNAPETTSDAEIREAATKYKGFVYYFKTGSTARFFGITSMRADQQVVQFSFLTTNVQGLSVANVVNVTGKKHSMVNFRLQNKLNAGNNITIDETTNTISAKDEVFIITYTSDSEKLDRRTTAAEINVAYRAGLQCFVMDDISLFIPTLGTGIPVFEIYPIENPVDQSLPAFRFFTLQTISPISLSVSPYVTKWIVYDTPNGVEYIQDEIVFLQKRLTAGDNITISGDNVISATGGTSVYRIHYNPNNPEENTSGDEIISALESHDLFIFDYVGAHAAIPAFGIGYTPSGNLVTFSYIFEIYGTDELHYCEVNVRGRNYTIEDRIVQRKLTPGTNITIDENFVISAVETPEVTIDKEEKLATMRDFTTGDTFEIKAIGEGENIVLLAVKMKDENDDTIYFTNVVSQAQLNELLFYKQDKLTAGDNITIDNNVISAEGVPPMEYYGNWRFKRYKRDGKYQHFEAWFEGPENVAIDKSSGNLYRSDPLILAIPNEWATLNPHITFVTGSAKQSYPVFVSLNELTATDFTYFLSSGDIRNRTNIQVFFYVRGYFDI